MNNELIEQTKSKKKIHYTKWIYLLIVLLINTFIFVQAALPASESARWSNIFVRFFMNIFNGSGKDTTEIVDVSALNMNYDKEYELNDIEGYLDNEIVVGTTKRIDAVILPTDATNGAVSFSISDDSIASIYQNQNYAYVTGLKTGTIEITATSLANNTYLDKYTFNIVEAKAPVNYTVSDIEVYKGALFYLPITMDKSAHYDIDKLTLSHNTSITDKSTTYNGLYYASTVGVDNYLVGTKSFNVTVKDNSSVILPHFTGLNGPDSVTSKSSHNYDPLTDNFPTSVDVFWSVSDPSLASITKDGKLKVKEIKEEKKITITATSLLNSSLSISKEVTLKPVTITSFELVIPYYGTHITNMPYLGETGEEIKVWMEDDTDTISQSGVTVSSSNEEVAKVYTQGAYLYITCFKEGDTRITVTSINNPSVSKYIDLQVTIRGVINHDNYLSFSEFIRKSIGHFLLFLVNGVFTFLFMYELNKDVNFKHKKKWYYVAITLFLGLLFAGISEFIQYFTPTRFGSLVDVGVDALGFAVGVGIVFLTIYLIHRYKRNKQNKEIKGND